MNWDSWVVAAVFLSLAGAGLITMAGIVLAWNYNVIGKKTQVPAEDDESPEKEPSDLN